MFDCVMPTRNGRNGQIFTSEGTINLRNKKWEDDFSPLDPAGASFVDMLYSKAYVHHLVVCGEMLGRRSPRCTTWRSIYGWCARRAGISSRATSRSGRAIW